MFGQTKGKERKDETHNFSLYCIWLIIQIFEILTLGIMLQYNLQIDTLFKNPNEILLVLN